MKKLIGLIFLIMVLFSIAASVFAEEFSASVIEHSRDTDEEVYSVGAWYGVQFSYAPEDKGYFFVSQETAEVAPMGHAFDYNMTGIGLGTKIQITDGFKVFGQVSYNFIKNTWGKRPHQIQESFDYFMSKKFDASAISRNFDGAQVENENAFAGTVGVQFDHKFTKNLSGSLVFSKRIMKIKEVIRVFKNEWNYEKTGACWETGVVRNFASTDIQIRFGYTF